MTDPFSARRMFDTGAGKAAMYSLASLEEAGLAKIDRLPYSIRVLLEAVLRNCDGFQVTEDDVKALAGWQSEGLGNVSVAFKPARVILQDFTGVPAVVDLAAMRDAMKRLGGDPKRINPLIPVDLVIDHSVQVDSYGSPDSLRINTDLEFQRNRERYEFLRWGQKSFTNFSVLPPALGIIHQVNLEYLAKAVVLREDERGPVAFPDTVVGTDSHTPMINGLGVLGWGVGGIEAEAVMLGEPLGMLAPEVVGFELVGALKPGVTATDIVLAVTQILRHEGVVGKFVEYFGEAIAAMGVADRALVSNMSPEYGATVGFFPTDERTLEYLRLSGRDEAQVQLVERYCREQQLFRDANAPLPQYTRSLRLDLGTVEPSMAGPKRPQDRVLLKDMKASFRGSLSAPHAQRGFELAED
ncbi:MAG: aconitase family protein, partial [Patescibacteria group bacterium]|nr:aconitase family protein [Patescibacteria group bacterium]